MNVPISLIAPLIQRWMDVYGARHGVDASNQVMARYVENPGRDGHLAVLAFHCGVNARYLRSIMKGRFEIGDKRNGTGRNGTARVVDYVPFDIADKIVCGTVGPLAWQVEPLSQFYGPLPVARYERHLETQAA